MKFLAVTLLLFLLNTESVMAGGLSSFIDDEYRDAMDKAMEAFMIQSGVKKVINKKQKEVLNTVEGVAEDLGIKEEVVAVGYVSKILIEKEISFQIRNVMIEKSICKVSLSPEKVEFGVRFKFD